MAFAGDIGLEMNLKDVPGAEWIKRDDLLLFNESPGRILLEVPEDKASRFESMFEGFPCARIGRLTKSKGSLRIIGRDGGAIVDTELSVLRRAFKDGLGGQLR
jgi:phosphoribosylformylglycinamidine (FGAM) synthase-like enzyme